MFWNYQGYGVIKGRGESQGDASCFGTSKGPEQTEVHESKAEQKKPHLSAESTGKGVLFICHTFQGDLSKVT